MASEEGLIYKFNYLCPFFVSEAFKPMFSYHLMTMRGVSFVSDDRKYLVSRWRPHWGVNVIQVILPAD